MADTDLIDPGTTDELGDLYGVNDDLVRAVTAALEEGRIEAVEGLIEPLHAADLADLFERFSRSARTDFMNYIADHIDPEFWTYVDEGLREVFLDDLDNKKIAAVVQELESDDAVDILEDLEADDQRETLEAVPEADRALLEDALRYPEDSAGRLMRREAATAPQFWKVGDAIDFMRSDADLPEQFYNLFVVDPGHKPIGWVPLHKLLRAERRVAVTELMHEDLKVLPAQMDQEDVAFLFRQYGYVSAPVVDDDGRMIGIVTIDDVVDVIDEEAEEDILKLAGVKEDDFYDAVIDTTRARFSWLLVNLGTAILSAIVIGFFEAAIEKVVALAILMPIVAALGGNAGTQALTVAVRALAMKELTPANALRITGKEILVGGINGFLLAIILAVVAGFWFADPVLGGVIAAAMVINLLVAGFIGVTAPLALDRMGIDPAVASSVVVTATTDVVGFFTFLGLAAWVLL
ncbi:MAG TPA: magnesium transporter [Rhodospirillaceae bacterium]|nr:magnesium transporter [Rhodospirillaceae bacterium]